MSFISRADALLVKRYFGKFYLSNRSQLYIPSRLPEREFGYFSFDGKVMIRHLSFNSPEELWNKIVRAVPLHIYHSAAFYKYPRAPMDEKGWLGAELIFDIDADHLETPCKKQHDYKVCKRCRRPYPVELERCPECGEPLMKVEWICDLCLESAREEARKLISFLEDDLGFTKLRIAFSGNRGYHVVVEDESILELDQMERKELIDYITGTGLDPKLIGLEEPINPDNAPDPSDPGWRGRIARAALELMMSRDLERLAEFLGDEERAREIVGEFEAVVEEWTENVPWNLLKRSTRKALFEIAKELAVSHIDIAVTQDIHRLLRLGNSLNGKTGLAAKIFDLDRLDEFDPMREAVSLPMDDSLTVYVISSPSFRLGGMKFESCRNELRKLPVAAGILLLCKGAATLP